MTQSRRILFISVGYPPDDIGGAERQAQRQAEALGRRGLQVTVVTQARSARTKCMTVNAIEVTRLGRPDIRWIGRLWYVAGLMRYLIARRRNYDLIHVHLANLQSDLAVVAGRLLRKPVHVKVAAGGPHGEIQRLRKLAVLTRRIGLRGADSVQAISAEIESELLSIGVARDRIRRIPNGLLLGAPSSMEAVGPEVVIPEDRVIVLYLGRLATYKGIGDLLDAWASEAQLRAIAHLLVVGPQALDRPSGEFMATPGVTFLGPTDDPAAYFAVADIFVLPSHAEGMSNAMLEAMAAGLPILATSVGAAREILPSGDCGVLVPPRSVELLAAALLELCCDEPLRRRLGGNARRYVQLFDIDRVAGQLIECYSELCGDHGRR